MAAAAAPSSTTSAAVASSAAAALRPVGAASAGRLAPLRSRWQALATRERWLVAIALALVLLALLWFVALRPAWTALRTLPAELVRLDDQWQQMQRLAAESRSLRSEPGVPAVQSSQRLQAATAALGEGGRLQVAGERATLTVNGAGGDELLRWLQAAREGARARPVELNLTRGADGDFRGSVVLALPAGAAP